MKKTIFLAVLFVALFPLITVAQNNIDKRSVTGSWMGKLNTGAITLRVVFNLSLVEKDSLVATLDSPDQGAKNIKLGLVTLSGDNIKISAGALLAEYNGTFRNDTLIEGKWTQAGNSIDLPLIKLKAVFAINRPQEPKPPYPYKSEDVNFGNKITGKSLSGTITIPEGKGPFPVVIMISGSGAQNRNEELMGHKPFMVIADHLTRNGIAVLRYDDRGVGKSQGNYASATTADLATDAEAAFIYLKGRTDIDPGKIGLAGHSEGGLIAPVVASSVPDVAFIVSLAGPGVKGEQLLHRQNRDISIISGADMKQAEEGISVNKKLFGVLKKETDNAIAAEKVKAVYIKELQKSGVTGDKIDEAVKKLNSSLGPESYNWFRYFIMTDPAQFWKRVKCPVLALNGEKDLQVAADENLAAIEKALRSGGNNSYTIMSIPGLNHLFQHCTTGLPAEYGEIEETFSPEVLKIISDWIQGL